MICMSILKQKQWIQWKKERDLRELCVFYYFYNANNTLMTHLLIVIVINIK